jgi:hypothetical protein
MRLAGVLRALAPLALLPVVVGCADVTYRERATLSHTRYAVIENFGDEDITAEQVDGLLEEVAQLLHVTLSPGKPKVRIMVMPANRIAELYQRIVTVVAHGGRARAIYLPGANVVAVPYYSRSILGHELAHYLTDHYLKSTPRRNWERIALRVEDALPAEPRTVARRAPAPDVLATQAVFGPVPAQAN